MTAGNGLSSFFTACTSLDRAVAKTKTFTAEEMATSMERTEKTAAAYTEMPATNMWCAHTKNPRTAMPMLEKATKW